MKLLTMTLRPVAHVVTLSVLLGALAACGGAPQTSPQATAIPANPAPSASPAESYPAQGDGAPTAYPAPEGAAPTTYPPPLGGSSDSATAAPAPTGAGQGGALSLPAGFNNGPIPAERAAAALADLVQRAGVAPDAVTVLSAEAVEWRDGSIGCPRDGIMYPQVITPGFRLLLSAGGQEYAYHSARDGELSFCPNPTQ